MTQRSSVLFKISWISLGIIGIAILVFGLITTVVPASPDPPYMRAIGVASIGMTGYQSTPTIRLPGGCLW